MDYLIHTEVKQIEKIVKLKIESFIVINQCKQEKNQWMKTSTLMLDFICFLNTQMF